jgi:ATP-dependent DNA helicase RecG
VTRYIAGMKVSSPLTAQLLHTTGDFVDALKEMEIKTVKDLLLYMPRGHEDLSQVRTLAECPIGEKVSVRGTVGTVKFTRLRGGKSLLKTTFTDTVGDTCEVTWFNQPHIKRMLPDESEVVLTGKLKEVGVRLEMSSPTFEIAGSRALIHAGRLVPLYPQHDRVTSKWLREKIALVRHVIKELPETLDAELVKSEGLMSRAEAIEALHFPEDPAAVERARERIAFEEMLGVQQEALERKKEWKSAAQDRLKIPMDAELIKSFFSSLKFTPTDDQRIAIYEILKDMEKDRPMSRLLEGDVGSGKTLVAVAVTANAIAHGGQVAIMVPTEVLARQHVLSISKLLLTWHNAVAVDGASRRMPNVQLLMGSMTAGEKDAVRQSLAAGTVDVIVGTHALIEDSVQFRNLLLVVVDEQHRFGVAQRARLKDKGSPHFLSMTATPIPRTLALTAYGDHDLSVLQTKPKDRKDIHTKVVSPNDRKTVELFIDQQIAEGRQVFVICPLIAESESEDIREVKNVQQEKVRLEMAFPHRRIALLHGRMPAEEKESVMAAFKAKESDILVSTSVIEVGIDVPNASIIIIEGAERFGLSQLHQFRGRVGRGECQSHCFLFTTTPEQSRSPRLKAMEQHHSGFHLAEIDLRLRGPGELFGTRQSGLPDMRFPQLFDPAFVLRVRRAAEKLVGVEGERSA